MSFCTSCGKQIEDNSLFCEHCGARQEQSAPVASASPAPPPPVSEPSAPTQSAPEQGGYGAGTAYGQAPVPAAPRKPIPKGLKIAVLVVVILAVLAALFVFIMGKINDPQKTIAAFADSILTQDYEQFSKVTCPAGELELTEESVAPFFALYSDRTSALEEFQDSLSTDLKQLQQGRASTGNGLVRLVAQDRIFFKTYQVELSGTTISLSAPLNDVEVTVGGKTVELPRAEETAQVLLLPGRYDIEAQCTNDILGETFTTRMTDCELTQSSNYWYISMDYTTVWLEDIGREVSSLTVNGKDY